MLIDDLSFFWGVQFSGDDEKQLKQFRVHRVGSICLANTFISHLYSQCTILYFQRLCNLVKAFLEELHIVAESTVDFQ
jgi:hypothetical protein